MKCTKSTVANAKVRIAFFYTFTYCHYQGCQKCEKYYEKKKMMLEHLDSYLKYRT